MTVQTDDEKEIQIADIGSLQTNQSVNTIVKVLAAQVPVGINTKDSRNLMKQDCTVGDSTGCRRLVLWQNDIGKLCEGKSYKLKGLTVRLYNLTKYLNAGPTFSVELADDIGEVSEDVDSNEQSSMIIGDIDSVMFSEAYASCKSCKSKCNKWTTSLPSVRNVMHLQKSSSAHLCQQLK